MTLKETEEHLDNLWISGYDQGYKDGYKRGCNDGFICGFVLCLTAFAISLILAVVVY